MNELEKLTGLMLQAFGNNFTYYLKTHNFHWTVMGPDFPQYHALLNEIYDDAQDNIDNYAEQLRKLGMFPKGDYRDIMSETQLTDPTDTITDPGQIFAIIDADLDIIVKTLQDTFDCATYCREYGLQNFLADRIDSHRRTQWQVDAILNEQNSVPESQEITGE